MRAPRAALALLCAAVLAAAGCSSSTPEPQGGAPTTVPAPTGSVGVASEQAADPANARFYDQELDWVGCGEGLECSTATVPVDWAAPAGATLEVALARRPAGDADERRGALLVNPGGPGGSGVDWVRGSPVVSEDVAEQYDVVGFDPRGVGSSAPVDCLSDPELDAYLSADGPNPEAPGGLDALRAEASAFAAGCQADAGALLPHVGTVDAARDMDVLRAVLGSEQLDYLGKSYGTLLGAVYAGLFPQRVGRFVLDGALDPASSYDEVTVGQAAGLEQALRAYVDDCPSRRGCPLAEETEAALTQIRGVVDAAEASPLTTSTDQPLTGSLATTGIITPLYDDESWPVLDQALAEALDGQGEVLRQLADAYADRRPDGTYASNLLEAFVAVNCLDYPVDADPERMRATADALAQASPTFGESMAYGEVQCAAWPAPPTREPGPIAAEGAAPILVVGTTGDPATPYAWAQALADELSSGRLLTWEGEGHTAYARGSQCVDAAVDGWLLGGVLPGEGATCPG